MDNLLDLYYRKEVLSILIKNQESVGVTDINLIRQFGDVTGQIRMIENPLREVAA